MPISASIKFEAFELILHGLSAYKISRRLGVSKGAVQAWMIFTHVGDFSWLDAPWRRIDRSLLKQAAAYWAEHPIPYGFVARKFGLRVSTLRQYLNKKTSELPDKLRPKVAWYWRQETADFGYAAMIDIPRDRPLNDREYKALKKEIKEARDQLLVAQATWEVLLEDCHDEIKKKLIESYIERTKKALASLPAVD